MLIGVSGESLCGLIVGLRDSFPPFVSLIYMVSRMRVRWWGVTSVDAYMVMGVSLVSGKSPAEPDQKELPQTATESVGMIVSAGVVRYFLIVSVWDSSAISIHGRLCVNFKNTTHGRWKWTFRGNGHAVAFGMFQKKS